MMKTTTPSVIGMAEPVVTIPFTHGTSIVQHVNALIQILLLLHAKIFGAQKDVTGSRIRINVTKKRTTRTCSRATTRATPTADCSRPSPSSPPSAPTWAGRTGRTRSAGRRWPPCSHTSRRRLEPTTRVTRSTRSGGR